MSENPFQPSDNPYESPNIVTSSSRASGDEPNLSGAARMLRETKPWVRFISVMMFLGAGFLVLGGIGMMLLGGRAGPGMPGSIGPIVGVVYLVMAVLYVVPGMFLWAYADRIGTFLSNQTPGTLTSALESQKSFWRFVGIMMVVILCIYGGILVLAIVGAAIG